MPKALKVILAIVAGFTLVCIVTAVVGANYLKQKAQTWVTEGATITRDGRAYGSTRDGTACLTEGFRRVAPCSQTAIGCQISAQMFTQSCLATAQEVPSLCGRVTEMSDIRGSITWRMERCSNFGHGSDPGCPNFLQCLQHHCVDRLFQQQQGGATAPTPAAPTPTAPLADPATTPKPSTPEQP